MRNPPQTLREFPPLLPWLWVAVILNIILADVLSLYIPGAQEEVVEFAGSTSVAHFMLFAAIAIELPIAAMLLTRLLRRSIARWINIAVAIFSIAFVVGGGSSHPHYIFLASIELICLGAIVWIAWKWPATTVAAPA